MNKRDIRCFWLEPTSKAEESLRRYSSSTCPAGGFSYHNAEVVLGQVAMPAELAGLVGRGDDSFPHDDPRWPTKCDACDYVFDADDNWQHKIDRLYQRDDTGELVTIRRAPVGAMWHSPRMAEFRKPAKPTPDGLYIYVKTPGGDWPVDGPSSDGGYWKRTGTPPHITVRPSIGIGRAEGGGWAFHAFLTDGVLKRCSDSRL